ncbi:MAG: AraC family transcriptional regulator [Oscillospiraceae bacterium]|nr:AraC family transcriptional regulator [Oscillospiraceae bacterium]
MEQRNYLLDFALSGVPCQIYAVTPGYVEEDGAAYHVHRHSSFELHAVLGGSAVIRVGGEDYEISANQGVIVAPGVYHSVRAPSAGLEKMCVSFSLPRPETIRQKEAASLSAAFYAQEGAVLSTRQLEGTLRSIAALVKEEPSTFWDAERLKAQTILMILGIYDELADPITIHGPARQTASTASFIIDEFFNLHYDWNNGNEYLAQQLHISTRQLDRILQKRYHMSYREKLLDIRLTNALDYLLSSDRSITEISEMVGYSSPANFSAFIKRATGKSPSEIRREGKPPR